MAKVMVYALENLEQNAFTLLNFPKKFQVKCFFPFEFIGLHFWFYTWHYTIDSVVVNLCFQTKAMCMCNVYAIWLLNVFLFFSRLLRSNCWNLLFPFFPLTWRVSIHTITENQNKYRIQLTVNGMHLNKKNEKLAYFCIIWMHLLHNDVIHRVHQTHSKLSRLLTLYSISFMNRMQKKATKSSSSKLKSKHERVNRNRFWDFTF